MILYSNTASDLTLVSYTRTLLGDPDGAPLVMWTDAEYVNALNIGYKEAWKIAKNLDVGWGHKTAYQTSTAGTILYDMPSDLDGRIVEVAIEANGKDLSSDSDAQWTYLTPMEGNVALKGYRMKEFNIPRYVFIQDRQFGVIAPPSTGGTNSLFLTYEGELSASDLLTLSTPTMEPIIPESDHPLLCYLAAITLRIGKQLPTNDIRTEAARKYPMFIEQASEPIQDLDGQVECVGRETQYFATRTGMLVRR